MPFKEEATVQYIEKWRHENSRREQDVQRQSNNHMFNITHLLKFYTLLDKWDVYDAV